MSSQRLVAVNGNLSKDVELRYTPNETAIAEFSIACNGRRKIQGEWQDYPHFFDCVMFGKRAESLGKHAKKGSSVWLEGRLSQDRWMDKASGRKRSKVYIEVTEWGFQGRGPETEPVVIDEPDMPF